MKNVLLKLLKTNWLAIVILFIYSVLLKVARGYNMLVSFIILLLSYFILGVIAEFVLEKIEISKLSGKRPAAPARRGNTAQNDQKPPKPISTVSTSAKSREIRKNLVATSLSFSHISDASNSFDGQNVQMAVSDDSDVPETKAPAPQIVPRVTVISDVNNLYRRNTEINRAKKLKANNEQTAKAPTYIHEESVSDDDLAMPSASDTDDISKSISEEVSKRLENSRKRHVRSSVPDLQSIIKDDVEIESNISPEDFSTYGKDSEDVVSDDDDKVNADSSKIKTLFGDGEEEEEEEKTETDDMITPAADESAIDDEDDDDDDTVLPEADSEEEATDTQNQQSEVKEVTPSNQKKNTQISQEEKTFTQIIPDNESKPYIHPSIDILKTGDKSKQIDTESSKQEQSIKAKKLIDTLTSFGVGAKVVNVMRGPAVTRYEIQPLPGVKVSRIVALTDDISLNLAATGVRMEAPIPGKEAIGIEIPNRDVELVFLRDIIDSNEYREAKSPVSFAIGKDIAGKCIIADISKMPHLLIAGATGSGKSVCINTIIASILYKSGPEDVRMIMIDPKIVELSVYNGIPHLLVPVVTDPRKAAGALAWAVNEMEKRYSTFSFYGVRDINSYNNMCQSTHSAEKMPRVVIIIDELADLMMAASKEIEESVIRLAQKARAAGLHIIIATQRPSVDVITGLIKANIPSRIAFAVSSQVDSKTILDKGGAEKLLGRGDMLFHPLGYNKPLRVQGAFVSDGEIEKLVASVKENCGEATYSKEIEESIDKESNAHNNKKAVNNTVETSEDDTTDDSDVPYVEAAMDLAIEFKQLSSSFLQRKLRLGFTRAARIIDILEDKKYISAADGSKPRRVLISKEEWDRIKNSRS